MFCALLKHTGSQINCTLYRNYIITEYSPIIFSSISEYLDFEEMHDDLEEDRLDGLLIDRYQASHLLHRWGEVTLRVLENIDVETHYKMVRVVGRNDAIGTNDCFTGAIKRHKRLTQRFVTKYVKPVQVR